MTLPDWLARAVFYRILPQSFYDANGDGVGDLAGIEAKLDYLDSLGINALSIAPCYASPFRNAGFDVADHRAIAPRYGTHAQFASLLSAAQRRGIRVVIELVPGHTSDRHAWFDASRNPAANEFTDRYVWTNDPRTTRDDEIDFVAGASDRHGAYAIERFAHQCALNYGFARPGARWQHGVASPAARATRAALRDTMKFWLDAGVDGFRVDGAHGLVKRDPRSVETRRLWRDVRRWLDGGYRDRVLIADWSDPELAIDAGFHVDAGADAAPYRALLGGRDDSAPRAYFDSEGRGDFRPFFAAFEFQRERIAARGFIGAAPSDLDAVRPSDGRDVDDLKVFFVFLLTWAHVPLIYYGDEIGMRYVPDLTSVEGGYEFTGSRTPMQWDATAHAGFSVHSPWLPIDPSEDRPNVATQRANRASLWHHVERLIYLRVTEADLAPDASLEVLSEGAGYPLVYRRGSALIVALNPAFSSHTVALPPVGDVAPVIAHHCHATHGETGWRLEMGSRGYGVFSVR